jgi:glutathione synthase
MLSEENVLRDDLQVEMLQHAVEAWAVSHGVLMGTPDRKAFLPAPVSLLPVSVSKELWEPLRNISADFDSLYNKVARDHDFLIEHLSKTAQADAFSARLVQILQDQIKEGIRQEIMFQINRNDYMWHDPVSSFKQVEFNSISAAFGYLSTKVAEMHSFMLERFLGIKDVVQVQQAHIGIAKGIHAAVEAFRRSEKVDGVLLMIVQPNERNSVDQRGIEYALWTQFRIPVIRRSLLEISTQGSLNSEKHLVM